MSRLLSWEQFVFGKVVEYPEGPVRSTEEMGRTGQSAAFPGGLMSLCQPARTGLGTRDLFVWREYPAGWFEEGGGIFSYPVSDAGAAYVLAGRVRGRMEGGENTDPPTRYYPQAHYLLLPAEKWMPHAVGLLSQTLRTIPMTARDMALPPIVMDLDTMNAQLPDGWTDVVAPILEVVLSGLPLSLKDTQKPVHEFLREVMWCLASVPPALAWRIPFGAGMVSTDELTAIGLGMHSTQGVQIIEGQRRGAVQDLSRGTAYAAWVKEVCGACRTLDELREKVARTFPEFQAYDGIPVDIPWRDAAAKVVGRFLENPKLEALKQWLETGEGTQPDTEFVYLREEALQAILDGAAPRGGTLLDKVMDPQWDEAWRICCAEDSPIKRRAVGALVNKIRSSDPRLFVEARNVPLPAQCANEIVHRLVVLIKTQPSGAAWAPLVQGEEHDAKWTELWRQHGRRTLVWVALRDRTEQSETLWQSLPKNWRAVVDNVMAGAIPSANDVDTFFATVLDGYDSVIHWLVSKVEGQNLPGAIVLAQRAHARGIETRLEQRIHDPSPRLRGDREQLAQAVAARYEKSPFTLNDPMVFLLLTGWESLSPTAKQKLEIELARAVGSPYAFIMMGLRIAPSGPGSFRRASRAACACMMKQDPARAARVMEFFGNWTGPEQEQVQRDCIEILRELVKQSDTSSDPIRLRLLRALLRHENEVSLPQGITDKDVRILRNVLADWRDEKLSLAVFDSRSLDDLRTAWNILPKFNARKLTATQMTILLASQGQSLHTDMPWNAQGCSTGFRKDPGWRLLFSHAFPSNRGLGGNGTAVPVDRNRIQLTSEERQALEGIPVPFLVRLACGGSHLLPQSVLERIDYPDLIDLPDEDVVSLVEQFREAVPQHTPGPPVFLDPLLRLLIERSLAEHKDFGEVKRLLKAKFSTSRRIIRFVASKFRTSQPEQWIVLLASLLDGYDWGLIEMDMDQCYRSVSQTARPPGVPQ